MCGCIDILWSQYATHYGTEKSLVCLGIPMRIVAIDGLMARCEAKGTLREVSLLLLQGEPLAAGDFVLIHLGNAVQKISEEDAWMAWALYDEILAAETTTQDDINRA